MVSTSSATTERSADDMVRNLVDSLGEASAEAEARLTIVAGSTEAGVRRANAALRGRSDTTLGVVGAFSLGLAAGLLLSGANRFLTLAALAPAALVASVVLERIDHDQERVDRG